MNSFDSTILHFVSQFAFRVPAFDKGVVALTGFYATRGLVLVAMLWWIWSRGGSTWRRDREIVISTIAAGFVALILGRLLAEYLPFRVRPLANPDLGLRFPMAADEAIRSWSAFPSDHAMLWCAIATGVFLASRRLGIFALAFAFIVVCLPRVYVGLHHPTDVLAGAAIGVLVCTVLCRPAIRHRIAGPFMNASARYPGPFHAAVFLLTFEMVTQFEEMRRIASAFIK